MHEIKLFDEKNQHELNQSIVTLIQFVQINKMTWKVKEIFTLGNNFLDY